MKSMSKSISQKNSVLAKIFHLGLEFAPIPAESRIPRVIGSEEHPKNGTLNFANS